VSGGVRIVYVSSDSPGDGSHSSHTPQSRRRFDDFETLLAPDPCSVRIVVDRIAPARKDRPVEFDLPPIEAPEDLLTTIEAAVSAMAAGELTPDEASAVAAVIEVKRRTLETVEIETPHCCSAAT
jgi:hypothetical protein